MKIGSLFSGIGGLELGLERAIPNARTVWQVESDPYARRVLAKNWPGVAMFEDVRAVGAHNLEPVDLICGGFPCTDLSIAGKMEGINGKNSGLWREVTRIIGDLRSAGKPPRYVVVENVTALLNRGMGRVLGDLAACGYDAIWDCIPAEAVSAHHRRDRLFIVAHSNSGTIHAQQVKRAQSQSKTEPLRNGTRRKVARFRPAPSKWPPITGICRVSDGIPNRMDRHKALGNAVVPQVAEVIGRVIVELEGQKG